MLSSDAEQYPTANGAPSNNTDPIGGDIDTSGGAWDEATDQIVSDVEVQDSAGSDNVYYGVAVKKIKDAASGTWGTPKIYNRAASITNASSGVANVLGFSANDTGSVRVTGKVGGSFVQDEIAVSTVGTNGLETWDVGSVIAHEYLLEGAPAKPIAPIEIRVAGELIAVIYGTGSPAALDAGNGNYQANALYDLAPATAKNTQVTWSGTNNRVTAPDGGVGSFVRANKWTGVDNSVALGADLVATDKWFFAARHTLPAGLPEPALGKWIIDVGLTGVAG